MRSPTSVTNQLTLLLLFLQAQSAELYRQPQTGGGQPYQNPDAYHHFTLPTMVKVRPYQPLGRQADQPSDV